MAAINRDLARTVLVDDTPLAFLHQPANGVPVLAFKGDPDDYLLGEAVLPLLQVLACGCDARTVLQKRFNMVTYFKRHGYPEELWTAPHHRPLQPAAACTPQGQGQAGSSAAAAAASSGGSPTSSVCNGQSPIASPYSSPGTSPRYPGFMPDAAAADPSSHAAPHSSCSSTHSSFTSGTARDTTAAAGSHWQNRRVEAAVAGDNGSDTLLVFDFDRTMVEWDSGEGGAQAAAGNFI